MARYKFCSVRAKSRKLKFKSNSNQIFLKSTVSVLDMRIASSEITPNSLWKMFLPFESMPKTR
jgi:hypothetical protein